MRRVSAGVRMVFDTTPPNNDLNIAAALGIPNINIGDRTGSMPGYNITGFQTIGQAGQTPEGNRTTIGTATAGQISATLPARSCRWP